MIDLFLLFSKLTRAMTNGRIVPPAPKSPKSLWGMMSSLVASASMAEKKIASFAASKRIFLRLRYVC